jgi:hypothetical protein
LELALLTPVVEVRLNDQVNQVETSRENNDEVKNKKPQKDLSNHIPFLQSITSRFAGRSGGRWE